jgi:hypothetical protein
MPEPLKHSDIMAIADKAAPISAESVYRIVESSVSKKTAVLEKKIDALTAMVEELTKSLKKTK